MSTITFAAEGGQLQLNAFEPIIGHSLFKSLSHLRQGCKTLLEKCVNGITANREHLRQNIEHSIGIVTALNPYIGYENATAIAKEALESNRGVAEIVIEKELLTREQLDEILSPDILTHPIAKREKKV